MKKIIGALAIAGGILISSAIATPALAADIQGGEPSVSTSTQTQSATLSTNQSSETSPGTVVSTGSPSTSSTESEDPGSTSMDTTGAGDDTQSSQPGNSSTGQKSDTSSQGSASQPGITSTTKTSQASGPSEPPRATGKPIPGGPRATGTPIPAPEPENGVDTETKTSYDCTTGFVTKTLTETPYTWKFAVGNVWLKVPGTPVVTKTTRPFNSEEFTCPTATGAPIPGGDTPGTPTPGTTPTTQVLTPQTAKNTNGRVSTQDGATTAHRTVSNPPTALADTGKGINWWILGTAGILLTLGALALILSLMIKRKDIDDQG